MTANPGDAREQREQTQAQRRRPIPADTFAVRLAIARIHAGHLTIREAAEKCGLNYGSWSNWENGSKPRELLDVAHAVSEGLDVDHDWLLFGGPLSPAAPPRRTSSKQAEADTLPYHRRPARTCGDTAQYPPVTERLRGTRPPGHAGARAGMSANTEQRTTHPGGSEHRRPRRLKYPSAA